MTKKHFIELATVLRDLRASLSATDHLAACRAIAAMCRRANPRFDTERFLTACGVES